MADKTRENSGEHNVLPWDRGALTTAEEQREAPDRPKAERYQAEHVQLAAGTEGSSVAVLQRALTDLSTDI